MHFVPFLIFILILWYIASYLDKRNYDHFCASSFDLQLGKAIFSAPINFISLSWSASFAFFRYLLTFESYILPSTTKFCIFYHGFWSKFNFQGSCSANILSSFQMIKYKWDLCRLVKIFDTSFIFWLVWSQFYFMASKEPTITHRIIDSNNRNQGFVFYLYYIPKFTRLTK